jgi:hypothetical protein
VFATVYAVAIASFGGTAQLVVTWLLHVSGDPLAPAWYLAVRGDRRTHSDESDARDCAGEGQPDLGLFEPRFAGIEIFQSKSCFRLSFSPKTLAELVAKHTRMPQLSATMPAPPDGSALVLAGAARACATAAGNRRLVDLKIRT